MQYCYVFMLEKTGSKKHVLSLGPSVLWFEVAGKLILNICFGFQGSLVFHIRVEMNYESEQEHRCIFVMRLYMFSRQSRL